MDRGELVKDATEEPKGTAEEQKGTTMGEGGYKIQRMGSGCSASPVERRGSDFPYQSAVGLTYPTFSTPIFSVSLQSSDTSAAKEDFQCMTADTDCLICFDQYSLCRLPKVLACQHVFCAVCLKLILRNQEGAWRIVCPVCRKPTNVFGGLICSLSTKEVPWPGTLANLGPKGEGPCTPGFQPGMEPDCGTVSIDPEDGNRAAAKRLLFLLLLLVLLVILALPFVYDGLLKWVLGIAAIWGLAMAGVLCWNPQWQCSHSEVSILA